MSYRYFFKRCIVKIVPRRYQVPLQYYYNKWGGRLESEMQLLNKFVGKGDRVVDVGGNRGVYAYKLWRIGSTVEVFEPNLDCYSVIKEWAVGKKNVNVHPIALSSSDAQSVLNIPIDIDGVEHDAAATLESNNAGSVRKQSVSTKRLDSYNFESLSLIKIDVEGHESEVLEGAKSTIAKLKPILVIEIEQRHIVRPIGEVFAYVCSFGYQGYYFQKHDLISISNFDVIEHQSTENIGKENRSYINNFIFFDNKKLPGIQT